MRCSDSPWLGAGLSVVFALTAMLLVPACSRTLPLPQSVPAAARSESREDASRMTVRGYGKAVDRTPRPASSHADRARMLASASAPIGRNSLQISSDEDYVVRIVAPNTSCSGALISENLVLTAHHCVAARDQEGNSRTSDLAPQELTVELGSGHFPWAEVDVRAIVAPSCGFSAGAGDLAILVLGHRMRGVQTIQPNLDREPKQGDEVSHLGFGRCALSEDGIYLKRRASGSIDLVTKIGFRLNAPLCPGDSGGPVLDHQSGTLIGVVSAGAMDGDERTRDRVEFARLDPFRGLFANAERIVGGTPLSELPPVDCPAPVDERAKVKVTHVKTK